MGISVYQTPLNVWLFVNLVLFTEVFPIKSVPGSIGKKGMGTMCVKVVPDTLED